MKASGLPMVSQRRTVLLVIMLLISGGTFAWYLQVRSQPPPGGLQTSSLPSLHPEGEERQRHRTFGIGSPYSTRVDGDSAAPRPTEQAPETVSVKARALEFYLGHDSIHFDERAWLRSFLLGGPQPLSEIVSELQTMQPLKQLPADINFARDRPAEVMKRRAMLDLLTAVVQDAPSPPLREAALASLEKVLRGTVPSDVGDPVKRLLVSEKYEVLMMLARSDPQRAISTFDQLDSSRLRELLLPALQAGLRSSLPESEVAPIIAKRAAG